MIWRAGAGLVVGLLVLAPGPALARTPAPGDDPAVALLARAIVATRDAGSVHVEATGSGFAPGGVGGMPPITLDGATIAADLHLVDRALALTVDVPALHLENAELRIIGGDAWVKADLLDGDGRWIATPARALGRPFRQIPGMDALVVGGVDPTRVERAIGRELKTRRASIDLTGDQPCDTGTCTGIHVEAAADSVPLGLAGLLGGKPGALAGAVIAADILVDSVTSRLVSIDLLRAGGQVGPALHVAFTGYGAPVAVAVPPADQVVDTPIGPVLTRALDAVGEALSSTLPTPSDRAIAAVRATDPRFTDLPTAAELQRTMSREFDSSVAFTGSWIGVAGTWSAVTDNPVTPAWFDPGTGRIVEVMLVDGCASEVEPSFSVDPCAWRHSWMFHVAADGTVTQVAESTSPDRP